MIHYYILRSQKLCLKHQMETLCLGSFIPCHKTHQKQFVLMNWRAVFDQLEVIDVSPIHMVFYHIVNIARSRCNDAE